MCACICLNYTLPSSMIFIVIIAIICCSVPSESMYRTNTKTLTVPILKGASTVMTNVSLFKENFSYSPNSKIPSVCLSDSLRALLKPSVTTGVPDTLA